MNDFFEKLANLKFTNSTMDSLKKEQLEMHLQLLSKIVVGLKPLLKEYEEKLKLLGFTVSRFDSEHYFRFIIRDSNSNSLEIGLGHYYDLHKWSVAAKHNDSLSYPEGPIVNESWQNADFEKWMQKQILEFSKSNSIK
jgi:hypothetical protein